MGKRAQDYEQYDLLCRDCGNAGMTTIERNIDSPPFQKRWSSSLSGFKGVVHKDGPREEWLSCEKCESNNIEIVRRNV